MTTDYSRGDEASLPANDSDLENVFTWTEYVGVSASDDSRIAQTATDEHAIFLFKDKGDSADLPISGTWEGQSDLACSTSTIYLQVFNRTLGEWETVDSDSVTGANTDFTLTGGKSTNLSDYYDVDYWVAFRVYQEAK